jgi:hypothetical protein
VLCATSSLESHLSLIALMLKISRTLARWSGTLASQSLAVSSLPTLDLLVLASWSYLLVSLGIFGRKGTSSSSSTDPDEGASRQCPP